MWVHMTKCLLTNNLEIKAKSRLLEYYAAISPSNLVCENENCPYLDLGEGQTGRKNPCHFSEKIQEKNPKKSRKIPKYP